MPSPDSPTVPGFWRCLKCGTPNPGTLYLRTCVACGYPRPAPGFEAGPGPGSIRPTTRARGRGRLRSPALTIAVAAYGLVLIAAFLLQWGVGDGWWPGMVLYLAPRVAFLVPLVPLALWAWRARRPAIGAALALEALFVAGPLMGFVVPWARLAGHLEGTPVRIMTFNRGGGRVDEDGFLRYLVKHRIDVVCFQEMGPAPMIDGVLAERGWHRDGSGAIASRFPILEDYPRSPEINEADRHYTALLRRVRVRGPGGREFVVGCLHMPTARYAFDRLRRLDASDLGPFIRWWGSEFVRMFDLLAELGDLPILVGGDFNNGPESRSLANLRDSGRFRSAFDEVGWGWGYTRPASFAWARIDHILASSSWAVTGCWVGPSFGSDHKALIAEVSLPAQP